MSSNHITVDSLEAWLADGAELAVLDIRDPAEVGYASPLFATNVPSERLQAEISRYIPRKVVRTVLVDSNDGKANDHVERLRAAGWTNISALEGGIPAWTAKHGEQGGPTFDIPGVDFTLAVQREKGTPVLTAAELEALRDQGADVVVIDTRTIPEYTRDHVPGAVGLPGAELLLRFKDIVPSDTTKVVVSCAGLPRAILGAQSLIDAGVPNDVSYLHDGTKAWAALGIDLEVGRTVIYGEPSETATEFAKQAVATLSAVDRIPEIDVATAREWAHDDSRTTYLLDVRTPEEFETAHLEGTISSEGGQLLGVAYRTISVRGSRVVLVDDKRGVRARTVAHWLRRRGYEIALLLVDFDAEELRKVA